MYARHRQTKNSANAVSIGPQPRPGDRFIRSVTRDTVLILIFLLSLQNLCFCPSAHPPPIDHDIHCLQYIILYYSHVSKIRPNGCFFVSYTNALYMIIFSDKMYYQNSIALNSAYYGKTCSYLIGLDVRLWCTPAVRINRKKSRILYTRELKFRHF